MVITAGMLNYADRQIIAVLKPLIQHDLGWTDVDYGNLTSVFQLASALALLFAGRLVDRIGWRKANPLAVGSWSLAAMAHAVASGAMQFSVVRFALGATEALATPTAIKTLAATFPVRQRSLALGVMNASNGLGAIVTPLIIPALALAIGWKNSFLVSGGLGLVWVAVWLTTRPGAREEAEDAPAAAAPAEPLRWRAVLSDRRTWAIAGAKMLSDQVWWLLLFWAPDLLHRVYGLKPSEFGLPVALMYLGASIGSLAAGAASKALLDRGVSLDRTRKGSLFVLGLCTLPLSLSPHVGSFWWATLILAVTLGAHQGYSTNVFALCADIIPKSKVATVVAFGAFCGNMAGMAILQAAGRLLAAGFGYGPLMAYASIAYLAGLLLIHLILPKLEEAGED
jgi:ACS family hexuronate transporter-like MFS transporter